MTNRGRLIWSVLIFLIVGAMINVAVAWWLGWRVLFRVDSHQRAELPISTEPPFDDGPRPERPYGPAGLVVRRFTQTGADDVAVQQTPVTAIPLNPSGTTAEMLWPDWGPLAGRDPVDVYQTIAQPIHYAARGWPMLSMWCTFEPDGDERPIGGISLGHKMTPNSFILNDLVLPFRPLVPGFAVNTLLYGGISCVLVTLPFVLRRRWRIHRGVCAACAYPIGTSPVCTECGTSVPH